MAKRSPHRARTNRRPHTTKLQSQRAKAPAEQPTDTTVSVSSAWQLLVASLRQISTHRGFFGRFVVVYALLSVLLVHNFNLDVASIKQQFDTLLGNFGPVASGFGTYFAVLTASSGASGAAGILQYILLVVMSLALIWALRTMTAAPPTVRTSLYLGMTPLVPFVLVLLTLSICSLPFAIGASVYSLVMSNGIAVGLFEQLAWLALFLVLGTVSVWLFVRLVLAIYIVTLPDVRPVQAMRSAWRLSRLHVLQIIRKLLLLGLVLLVASAVVVVPVIMVWAPLVQWVLFVYGFAAFVLSHTYLYGMYKEFLP